MGIRFSGRLLSLSSNKRVGIIAILLIAGTSTAIAIANNAQEKIQKLVQHSLPIKENLPVSAPLPEILLPMPIGEVSLASSNVESTRNPFQEPSTLQSSNINVLNSVIKFHGIAKTNDSLVAMIKTEQGQQAFKVGDSLGNGFIIKSISVEDVTVDISNGFKFYRLSLYGLRK